MGKIYSDDDRALALAAIEANGGDIVKAARFCGIHVNTLRYWAKGGAVNKNTTKLRIQKKASIADRLEAIVHSLIDAMPDKIEEATLQQVSTSIGIAVDKMRLLREEPTNISANLNSPEARMERLAAIFDSVSANRGGGDPPHGQPGSDDGGGEQPTVH